MKRTISTLLLISAFAASSTAQQTDWSTVRPDPNTPQGEHLQVPEGWKFRVDRTDHEVSLVADEEPEGHDVRFVNMTPGWHVTTGPALILYHPALSAEGRYRAEAAYHLFDPGDRKEAFGIFVGGRELEADGQEYLYFLIRKTGEYLVKRRHGEETTTIEGWSAHPAVVPYTEETSETASNVLAIETTADSINFIVNDETVTAIPKADLPTDGVVGLRVNHRLNVHVSDLSVSALD